MKEKLSLLTDLIKLSKADNMLSEIEYNFIHEIAKRLGIGKQELDELFNSHAKYSPPESEFERIIYFQKLVMLMKIDQNTDTKEIDFMKNAGIKLGLNPLATDQVMEEMEKHPNEPIPATKLIQIYMLHNN